MNNKFIDSSIKELEDSLDEIKKTKKLSLIEITGIKSKIRTITNGKDMIIKNFSSKNKELELKIKEKDSIITEKDKTIIEKDRVIVEKDRHIERLEKRETENKNKEMWAIIVALLMMVLSVLSSDTGSEVVDEIIEFIFNCLTI